MLSIRQDLWRAVPFKSSDLDGRQRLGLAARRRNPPKTCQAACREHDGSVYTPASLSESPYDMDILAVAERDSRTACKRDLLQLSFGKEADPAPVWREEGTASVLGPRYGLDLVAVQRPNEELVSGVNERLPIG